MADMIGKRAVVVGGGIAGLTAARALADRFEEVVVLDRDELPDEVEPRKGVPQGHHAHTLMAGGRRALEELFPGLDAELVEAGAVDLDHGLGISTARFGRVGSHWTAGVHMMSASRPLVETSIRRRVRAVESVRLRTGVAVSGLVGEDGRVTGVSLDDGEVIEADLVVDCTGRGTRSNHWLAALGLAVPESVEVKAGVGYASRLYRRTDLVEPKIAFAVPVAPAEFRAGLMLPIEGDRWLVSLSGWHDRFPHDDEEFESHAASLPHPAIREVVSTGEPLTGISVIRFPASRRRYFERLRRSPAGFLTLGDAVCSFNPIYGQGMSCAAMAAAELRRLLGVHGAVTPELSTEYYRRVAGILATPWRFATGGDYRYPQTEGRRPRGIRLTNAYTMLILLACSADEDLRRTYVSVQHLLLDSAVLRTPTMALRVLRRALQAARRSRRQAAAAKSSSS
ncbi:2-polyprenyl-6-methoxyphenol hydroxylase-like FAD-dependent oxidoreductase [Saccharothrix ecbatanensis]|uniref:2-polyprenyl-6-methoxyphenol hydroxylase-like FAD-dependent oxidoreductase n=2 Tax=Saccharothrix ecbatanensis TaxID=1105145 RepID=A0A7W9HLB6_9PSEU|nr:2-polyprenyl-6-methoxyphenol hydroxylase-like FAD-dependent oxidoreductase [Saccharothrix ecbatanensis]